MKRAVIINGVAAPVTSEHFLVNWLQNNGFKVQTIEPMLGEDIDKIHIEPEVIIGWSLGGLLAPKLAEKYPKAKLILISTGPKLGPKDKMAKTMFDVVKQGWGIKILYLGLRLPKKWLTISYKRINRMSDENGGVGKLLLENVDFFRGLSEERIRGVIQTLKETDNRQLLPRLKNKTLIFGGEDDKLMPIDLAKEMNKLIKNSRLVVTKGGHFNVITEYNLEVIGSFL
jgi:pimeloyl-[acyl-carrier protein] methyl ester esterase